MEVYLYLNLFFLLFLALVISIIYFKLKRENKALSLQNKVYKEILENNLLKLISELGKDPIEMLKDELIVLRLEKMIFKRISSLKHLKEVVLEINLLPPDHYKIIFNEILYKSCCKKLDVFWDLLYFQAIRDNNKKGKIVLDDIFFLFSKSYCAQIYKFTIIKLETYLNSNSNIDVKHSGKIKNEIKKLKKYLELNSN